MRHKRSRTMSLFEFEADQSSRLRRSGFVTARVRKWRRSSLNQKAAARASSRSRTATELMRLAFTAAKGKYLLDTRPLSRGFGGRCQAWESPAAGRGGLPRSMFRGVPAVQAYLGSETSP